MHSMTPLWQTKPNFTPAGFVSLLLSVSRNLSKQPQLGSHHSAFLPVVAALVHPSSACMLLLPSYFAAEISTSCSIAALLSFLCYTAVSCFCSLLRAWS